MKQLFIAWVPFQRRSLSMQVHFGYELHFLSFSFKWRFLRPVEYVLKSLHTLALFLSRRPDVIWVQLPPTPLLYLAFLYKKLSFHPVLIVADCHNATFRAPWIKLPQAVDLLQSCDVALVHSHEVFSQAQGLGLLDGHVYLLEDPTVAIAPKDISGSDAALIESLPHPWVLCPCSFNRDEPIKEVLEAARRAPEITFVLTGNFNRAQGIHDLGDVSDNVRLTGFLSVADFNALLLATDAVLGFTQLEGIQLSAAVEATAAGVPMVLSDTALLKELFYKGAVYVDSSDAGAIAQACKRVLVERPQLAEQVSALSAERSHAWLTEAHKVDALISQTLLLASSAH